MKLRMHSDLILFICIIFLISTFIVHGKALSSSVFTESEKFYQDRFWSLPAIVMFAFIALVYGILRHLQINQRIKFVMSCIFGFIAASGSFIFSVSILVFFLLFYIYSICSLIIMIDPYLKMDMDTEFWKILIDSGLRVMQFFLVVYIAGAAIGRFISQNTGETTMGFVSTMFYPLIVLIVGFWNDSLLDFNTLLG